MPQILERLVSQLMAKGKPKAQAYAIATSTLQKSGVLDKHGQLTAKGKTRQGMGASGRAKDRASKEGGSKHKPSEYTYSKRTNRATL